MLSIESLSAAADPTEHADWLELTALTAPDGDSSAQDLISALRRTGSSDAVVDSTDEEPLDNVVEREGEDYERIAEDALEQLAMRGEYLGDAYPFSLNRVLQTKDDAMRSLYAFLTAATRFAWKNSLVPATAASLFEEVSAAALRCYLGGERVRSYHFGFPRRNGPKAFHDAVEDLCTQMGEGLGCRAPLPKTKDVKDAKLDLVVWLPFGDDRSNQFCVFGQCTTGANWQSKINELQPEDFCKTWLKEVPAVTPSLAFFVPQHIEEKYWWQVANSHHRIMFDRLRIARLLHEEVDSNLANRYANWTVSSLGAEGHVHSLGSSV